ncbi:tail fiber protein [Pseudomonas protegens]|uniref:Tail fiber protein n=2 Tax=Pseudomonas protegens TaxID=380021 RepID=A0A7G8YVJ7_9PSED|nr:tail fiber protein [Pseudomonas protegens]QNL08891.1 tail fiber protein [Pseudomonas protegens]
MWCIKAWSAPINQGNIDVAALVKELAALKSAHPVGAIIPFPKAEVPAGYLELNGSVHSIAAYPDLAAYLGTTFNKGDEGAGNFRLPESRGEFLRGWDHGRGVDAGRALGTYQASMSNTLSKVRMEGGYDIGTYMDMSIPDDGTWSKKLAYDWSGHGLKLANSGSETRPCNLAVMWCIKAWSAPVNQGNIDVAALAPLAAQATEINQGTAKVSTTAQMLDSANDFVLATPKKLRWGFSISLATNGYIAFPSWLGGLIIQWGAATSSGTAADNISVSMPIAWPTGSLAEVATVVGNAIGNYTVTRGAMTSNSMKMTASLNGSFANGVAVRWIALGS